MDYKSQLERWLESPEVDYSSKEEIENLTPDEAEDSFYRSLEFGTGGLRGIMGVSTNRMNVYTVRQATQGLANEIISLGAQAPKKTC